MMRRDEQKRRADAAVLNLLHPGTVDDPDALPSPMGDTLNERPSFDGGAMPPPPRVEWERDVDDPGWVTTEIDAAVLWPGLGR